LKSEKDEMWKEKEEKICEQDEDTDEDKKKERQRNESNEGVWKR
jgi:hypothetical protein